MKTAKDILNFIKGTKANEQGLFYSYELINGEVVINWAGVMGDGSQPSTGMQFYGKSEIEIPQHKIDKALSDFIAIHGRQPFTILMVYPEPPAEQKAKFLPFAANEADVIL